MNGSSKNVFETYFDQGASHRPAWVKRVAAVWLDNQLHFANWKTAEIRSLSTIKIRDWAAKNDVRLNKSQMREDRDGGLEAIDADVPRLTPEQLSVLPRDQWEAKRDEFVYSTWATRAIADAEHSTHQ